MSFFVDFFVRSNCLCFVRYGHTMEARSTHHESITETLIYSCLQRVKSNSQICICVYSQNSTGATYWHFWVQPLISYPHLFEKKKRVAMLSGSQKFDLSVAQCFHSCVYGFKVCFELCEVFFQACFHFREHGCLVCNRSGQLALRGFKLGQRSAKIGALLV